MATQPQIQTVTSGVDKVKAGLALIVALGAFGAYFVLSKQGASTWLQWLAFLGCMVAAGAIFMTSRWGKEFLAYCRDSIKELKKVVWPTRKEAMQMTLYVFLFVLVMSIFLWVVDKLLEWGIYNIFLGWK